MFAAAKFKKHILTESPRYCVTKDARLWNNRDIVKTKSETHPFPLADLPTGIPAVIAGIHTEEALHQRLQALGFRTGKLIEIIRRARFSGPLQVRIGTTDILLRKTEAAQIMVRPV